MDQLTSNLEKLVNLKSHYDKLLTLRTTLEMKDFLEHKWEKMRKDGGARRRSSDEDDDDNDDDDHDSDNDDDD